MLLGNVEYGITNLQISPVLPLNGLNDLPSSNDVKTLSIIVDA